MKITTLNRQKRPRVNPRVAEALVRFFLLRPARRGSASVAWGEVTLTFVGHAEMREANVGCFGRPGTTDVISQVYTPVPGEPARPGADLLVNIELADEEGRRRRLSRNGEPWGLPSELALYIAHGCNHLLGGEDGSPAERRAMRRRELNWIRQARERGLLAGLV